MTVKWWPVLVALACCFIHRTVHAAASVRLMDLRPVPSNDPAVPDLVEMPNPALDPRPSDLNVTVLLAKLGAKFDPNYMSYDMPEHLVPVADIPFRRNRRGRLVPTGKMPTEIRDLDTKYFSLPNGRRLRTKISSQLRRKIQQYLWGRTMCPVQQRWKDLGQRFWPRWLLEGHCPRGETSCSVPSGMYCRATSNRYKTLLRWHCRSAGPSAMLQQFNTLPGTKSSGVVNPMKVCQWIKVEYPVVTECGCGCADNSE
ncbi:noggin-2-like isoform X2 [Daktulosphaira vitifoliae]|nr:noggin-2-like isoform X2 [Daktulosphaira vitifoliae]XP_050543356.1 noggin-2-like isoform X2 [Daktulosphaira vitifoliae]